MEQQRISDVPQWTFGDRMRKARRRVGMTGVDFAHALDVSPSALGQYETDRATPRDVVALAKRVEVVTAIPAAWMLGLEFLVNMNNLLT
jgi:transcriptional regulator with XRE-family HTH domain